MTNAFKKALTTMVGPMLRRPKRLQVAALCYREDGPKKKVLLVSSRDTGRWIIPKGWPIDGKDAHEAAMQEAWEEAGVKKGDVSDQVLGSYDYDKELKSGLPVRVETLVYPIRVKRLMDDYPEAHERRRKWVTPAEAANMVNEPQLKELLRQL
ncbi:NUDIX hydrolase [Shimia thalassica]|uniref:NUDIX hydrolase n=1 Tax=Shimia thalassica TaxID=1715693 RepID=UPI0026E1B94B|nr:NUDIX hydrolase [Shimia thalassica]MDO6520863.1 NUDIX hydrolase [Shimia thalassica]